MSFYKTLTPYYDQIFPANEKALSFLTSHFKKGDTLLDVGAGTGNMAISLSQQGFQVTAMEPEEGMAEQIQIKSESCHHPVTVTTKTMEQIETIDENYNGIYCIGNTLVHLNSFKDIHSFFKQTFQKLHSDGVFILQIVNFDKVLIKKDFTFPVIKKEAFTFERHYDLDENHILFTTTLSANGVSQKNTIPLYPATSTQLIPLLEQCGFERIKAYGNFEYKAYSIDSPALIIAAKKGKQESL
ncbi:class I SAM-dependent methyltransferase [Bacillus testis]|uniref:class I SAM-dependent methyltransferase n=1 Tax=Bacillus testis TaxID=1622072 RepID=UPI00067E9FDB|nr:class I SAM-dependent methyltransferase [Bacillus testis]